MPLQRYLAFEERLLIEEYAKKGLSQCGIARKINRSANCIHKEMKRAGFKNRDYSAIQAQKISDERQENCNNKKIVWNMKTNSQKNNQTRIENLEMQVEILHDQIKEILKQKKVT